MRRAKSNRAFHPSPIFALPDPALSEFFRLYGEIVVSYFQVCEPAIPEALRAKAISQRSELDSRARDFFAKFPGNDDVNELILGSLDSLDLALSEIDELRQVTEALISENEVFTFLNEQVWRGDVLYIDETIGRALNELGMWALKPSDSNYFVVAKALHSIPTQWRGANANLFLWFSSFRKYGISPSRSPCLFALRRAYRDYFRDVSDFRLQMDKLFVASRERRDNEFRRTQLVFNDSRSSAIVSLIGDFADCRARHELRLGHALIRLGEEMLNGIRRRASASNTDQT